MNLIWIIGAGKFGRSASRTLKRVYPHANIVVVDDNPAELKGYDCQTVCQDGIAWLVSNLDAAVYPAMIVPAIPVHVAFEWLKKKMAPSHWLESIAVPNKLFQMLPNAIRGAFGQVYVSNADFICPDNCPEPERLCTHTRRPRPREMNHFLAELRYANFQPIVIRSRQLAPGVGGYTAAALFRALNGVVFNLRPIFLCTACRCHGVVNAFKSRPKAKR